MHTKMGSSANQTWGYFFFRPDSGKSIALHRKKTLVEVYYMQLLIVLRSQEALKIIHAI